MNVLELKPYTICQHIRTQGEYIFLGFIQMKIGDPKKWTTYVEYTNKAGNKFARSIPEFEKNFLEIK